ncbi:ribosomal RNA small subunit methyltransferase E [Agromyces rhizosphaerae]|uniref:Ribosomal RNA small subunit methyltransferase E n=1 Tax=Agromyces rhizosphaerae TaxID=88374 RepID=A0A9W6D3L7_9MICO|nr:16S rRNA (uracil(1498)-N(3))-methyltransferase [Agromyces rhizosphaerae]GLI29033.1 ribosomal RNA small subunit methyltransferase E [Agromyces rhizosphaerae]
MASLFLREDLGADARPGAELELTGDEARHAATVNRVRVGEVISIGDGRGTVATGEVVRTGPRELAIDVSHVAHVEAPARGIVLVQALAKGDRDERAVQATTELGVDAVEPWAAARSVSRWDAQKARKGRERWASIAREAAKQSIRAWLPDVRELVTTSDLAGLAATRRTLVLEPTADERLVDVDLGDAGDVAVVVGPEGGIAPDELDRLEASGAVLVRMGGNVLRTSTAGPAAIALLSARLGRW